MGFVQLLTKIKEEEEQDPWNSDSHINKKIVGELTLRDCSSFKNHSVRIHVTLKDATSKRAIQTLI